MFRSSGIVVLRSALDPVGMERLEQVASDYFSAAETSIRNGQLAQPHSHLFNAHNMAASLSALNDCSPADGHLAAIIAASPVLELLETVVGERIWLSLMHSRIRKVYARHKGPYMPTTIDWHTDGSESVGYSNAYILWIPFRACSEKCQGVEFMLLDDVGNSEIFYPHLNVGDAVLFSDQVSHRTASRDTSKLDRLNAELRLFRDEDLFCGTSQKVSQTPFLNIAAFR